MSRIIYERDMIDFPSLVQLSDGIVFNGIDNVHKSFITERI